MLKSKSFTHLSKQDRISIEVLLHQGLSLSSIATSLSRPVSTISREVKRNGDGHYRASRAMHVTDLRHRQKPKHRVFDVSMKDFIVKQMVENRFSPELIAVVGKKMRSDFICTEWIYQWIWKMKFSQARADQPYQGLFKLLRHACRKRKRGNYHHNRGNILQRRWIDQRPRSADKRSRMGDLECDIMLGKDRQPGVLVALDRKTRKVWIRKLPTKNASYVIGLLKRICKKESGIKTITFDNDQSFAEHYRLHPLGIETFFTHPYSSQEKGSVENRIGLLRMFLPKQTDFTKVSCGEIKKCQNLINNRPLKMFQYKSPNQIHIS